MKSDLPKEVFEAQFEPDGTVPIVGDMVASSPSTNYLIGDAELERYKFFHPWRVDAVEDGKVYSDVRKMQCDLADFDPSSRRRKMLYSRYDSNDKRRDYADLRIMKRV